MSAQPQTWAQVDATNRPDASPAPGAPAPRLPTDEAAERYLGKVRCVLADEQRAIRASPGLDSANYAVLCQRLETNLDGGKLTRPLLVHVSFRAFGGMDIGAAATLGAGFEMLHSALLMHDDVIDRDFIRRGAPNLGAVYRDDVLSLGHPGDTAEYAGHAASIIAGDILLAGSIRLAALAGMTTPNARAIIDVVHAALLASAAGELDDLLFSLSPASTPVSEVLNMERLKTAAYSFEAPLQAGALLAGAPQEVAARLGRLGRHIGTAYQIIDDVLGTFGDPAETGKSIESDLRSGKRTVLTAQAEGHHGFRQARDDFAAGFIGIDDLRQALADCGVEASARTLASHLVSSALQDAEGLELTPKVMQELTMIGNHVLNRRR